MYHILSKSVRYCRLYIKKHFGAFFSVNTVYPILHSNTLNAVNMQDNCPTERQQIRTKNSNGAVYNSTSDYDLSTDMAV